MKNLKKIAEDLHHIMKDPNFESFIAEQIMSVKSSKQEEPYFSIINQNMTLDIWKNGQSYSLIKSVVNKKSCKDFKKQFKKQELIEEIMKIVKSFLD